MKGSIRFLFLKARVSWLFFKLLFGQPITFPKRLQICRKLLSSLKYTGDFPFINKFLYHEGKYYWDLYFPGFPSKSFEYNLKQVIARASHSTAGDLYLLVVAVTKKCGLQCEHCFEWDEINKPEILTEDLIRHNLSYYFRDGHFGQVFFSGGEPMSRYTLLLPLVGTYGHKAECWIISSGAGFSLSRAKELKQAGLTGMVISLDSQHANAHDEFRGVSGTYARALAAVKNAQEANLLTSLSLCVSKSTLNREFLDGYMDLAKELNVSFVQILEPRAEGKYRNHDVALELPGIELLEQFYIEYNTKRKYTAYPSVLYPDYKKRLNGCRGMVTHAYLDTNGDWHPCPFCKQGDGKCGETKLQHPALPNKSIIL
jgi:MoaA/NifB/PqqE/SkfB family radical SAM enzyme